MKVERRYFFVNEIYSSSPCAAAKAMAARGKERKLDGEVEEVVA